MTEDRFDQDRLDALTTEIADLRDRVSRHPRELSALERRLADARAEGRQVAAQNERLSLTLREARDRLVALKAQMDALGEPPVGFGTLERLLPPEPGAELRLAEIHTQGRKVRTAIAMEEVDEDELVPGTQLLVNESLLVVGIADGSAAGDIGVLKDLLPDGQRAVVVVHGDDEQVVRLSGALVEARPRAGDLLLLDRRAMFAFEVVPKLDVEELVLEEVPDIDYAAIGGLSNQIEQITDAVELPFLHQDLYAAYELTPPKGVLLYGPPGCGKTMIAKAVANSLAKKVAAKDGSDGRTGEEGRSFFLNVKGPELLNKYVGETERHIRLIFQRARAKASDGWPVIVFFDEMDSLFRTRGSGVSSDVENTIVPQLLSELDGVESLENVIIIGASNREDMIDPAILRPGRLDVKIKVDRPDAEAAREIFARYFTEALPLAEADLKRFGGDAARTRAEMIDATVAHMYAENTDNQFLEVTYAGGDKEILYFKDFSSGAMIQNIVGRAKKSAIKEKIGGGSGGLRMEHLLQACNDEFGENEDLPNTTNPDDWAKISGKKGERIVYIRPLFTSKQVSSRSIETATNTGQYL
ncbi:proteasome-associated ATPase [Propionibacteriaceae bacterium ES.041]|uniref:proteasome ATPase n=1 Tax=Enemella evansiae TaxID=2016499 RepID=UPI000C01E2D7|nr:proteasome ATPase [Enemella evansiae]PFG67265.1 proteasome-associated ATPase [Propionibacteriaceae bacterium ES.041]TDO93125.1 proteasome-associated ATPase [Enemella evansiae]